jgi:hypothetical protein
MNIVFTLSGINIFMKIAHSRYNHFSLHQHSANKPFTFAAIALTVCERYRLHGMPSGREFMAENSNANNKFHEASGV